MQKFLEFIKWREQAETQWVIFNPQLKAMAGTQIDWSPIVRPDTMFFPSQKEAQDYIDLNKEAFPNAVPKPI